MFLPIISNSQESNVTKKPTKKNLDILLYLSRIGLTVLVKLPGLNIWRASAAGWAILWSGSLFVGRGLFLAVLAHNSRPTNRRGVREGLLDRYRIWGETPLSQLGSYQLKQVIVMIYYSTVIITFETIMNMFVNIVWIKIVKLQEAASSL